MHIASLGNLNFSKFPSWQQHCTHSLSDTEKLMAEALSEIPSEDELEVNSTNSNNNPWSLRLALLPTKHFYLRKQSLSKLEIAICSSPFILSPTAGVNKSVSQSVRKAVRGISNKLFISRLVW